MKSRWLFLAAFVIGAIGGPWIASLPGFVMIGYGDVTVELRLSLALALGALLALALLFIGGFIGVAGTANDHIRLFTRGKRRRKAREQTLQGVRAIFEGRWSDAEALLTTAAKRSDSPVVNYLAAAMAAQELGAIERRDQHLQQAHISTPDADIAVGLTEARLHLRSGHYELAHGVLLQLDRLAPRHAPALKLLQHVQRRLGEWEALARLLPRLQKFAVLPPSRLQRLEGEILRARLKHASGDQPKLREIWKSATRPARRDVPTFIAYARGLIAAGAGHEAERLCRGVLEDNQHKDLIRFYGEIPGRDARAQLATAEKWLEKRAADAAMLWTLGRLAVRAQQWIKAQRCLNDLIKAEPAAEVWLLLAEVYEHLAEPDQMQACISRALQQARRERSSS